MENCAGATFSTDTATSLLQSVVTSFVANTGSTLLEKLDAYAITIQNENNAGADMAYKAEFPDINQKTIASAAAVCASGGELSLQPYTADSSS